VDLNLEMGVHVDMHIGLHLNQIYTCTYKYTCTRYVRSTHTYISTQSTQSGQSPRYQCLHPHPSVDLASSAGNRPCPALLLHTVHYLLHLYIMYARVFDSLLSVTLSPEFGLHSARGKGQAKQQLTANRARRASTCTKGVSGWELPVATALRRTIATRW
jgi:hypothetical protein